MPIYHTALKVVCEHKGCGIEAVFENPDTYPDAVLVGLAEKAGWYIPYLASSGVRCPKHHKLIAARFEWPSLYEKPRPKGVEINNEERQAKNKDGA